MASLTIENIPDDLYDRLKQAASAHHRSVNSELIYCLESALSPTNLAAAELKEAARALRDKVMVQSVDANEIDVAKKKGARLLLM